MAYTALKQGDSGDSVKQLQTSLKNAGYNLQVDGKFGWETNQTVKKYQQDNGLTDDGIVSEDMWNALTGTKTATPSDTSGDTPSAMTSEQALADLIKQYQSGNTTYTPKTDDEIKAQAQNEYQSYYDQLRQAAQQSSDTSDLALQQQKDALQSSYDKQRESTEKSYAQSYSQTDRNMLSRGMQRSSYSAQTLANLANEGAQAQGNIDEAQQQAEGNIDSGKECDRLGRAGSEGFTGAAEGTVALHDGVTILPGRRWP